MNHIIQILPLLMLLIPNLLFGQESNERTHNFPRQLLKVDVLPSKENVWVFIMAGQSNMAGRGFVEPQDTIPHPRIITIDKNNHWIYAKEPLHFYQPKLTGLDSGMSFAHELLKNVDSTIVVALLPCAVGGSSIDHWLNDSVFNGVRLKTNYQEKVDLAKKKGTLKGILWHQGESDAFPNKIPDYEIKLVANFTFFREYAENKALPIIVGELGSLHVSKKWKNNWNQINKVIHKVSNNDINCYLVKTSDLPQKKDSAHFNAQAQRILGQRYADAFLGVLGKKGAADSY